MAKKHICTEFKVQKIPGGIRKICRNKNCRKVVRVYSQGVFGRETTKGLPSTKKKKKEES